MILFMYQGGMIMAVKLRLRRMGSKKKPFYRIVAADSRYERDGRFLEIVGTYDPANSKSEAVVDEEKAIKWINTGAIPTDTVRDIFSKAGIMKKIHDTKSVK